MARYIPERGDLIALTFDPQSGHEQKGRRPALVISHHLFNKHTGLAIVCPITSTERDFPFHVAVTGSPKVKEGRCRVRDGAESVAAQEQAQPGSWSPTETGPAAKPVSKRLKRRSGDGRPDRTGKSPQPPGGGTRLRCIR